jgi:hypothetical protein
MQLNGLANFRQILDSVFYLSFCVRRIRDGEAPRKPTIIYRKEHCIGQCGMKRRVFVQSGLNDLIVVGSQAVEGYAEPHASGYHRRNE